MDIFQEALAVEDYFIGLRRHFHENPELSDQEDSTVAKIMETLTAAGIACDNVPGGGVMGYIDSGKPGKTVLLRADIDALPIQEDPCNTKYPKACISKVPGVMHACGHDTHTAVLLGASKILQEHRQEFTGRIVLYFERGEEAGHGDYYMMKYIQDQKIHVDGCWALHCRIATPTGKIGLTSGGIYAGATSWGVSISNENGKAVSCAAAVIRNLNTARMRNVPPNEPVTLTPCRFQFGTENVKFPGSCHISGTCRFYHADKAGRPMKKAIRQLIENTCKAYDCKILRLFQSGPTRSVINDPTCVSIAREAIEKALGKDALVASEPAMGFESFSILSSYYPSVMVHMGVGNPEKGMDGPAHNPIFDPDEAGFKYGVSATVSYALAFLANEKPIPFSPFEGDVEAYMDSIKN